MPLFTFSFDDGNASQLREIYPVLRKFGFRATFYIIGNRIGLPDRLNFEDLRMLEKEGNEIGSHSLSHRPLTGLGQKELEHEVVGGFQALREFNARSFSYPFGRYDCRVLGMVSRHCESARSYCSKAIVGNKKSDLRRYALQSFPIEGPCQGLIDLDSENCILSEQSALRSYDWFILTLHGQTSLGSGLRTALRRSNLSRDQARAYISGIRRRLLPSERESEQPFTAMLESFCARLQRLGLPVATVSKGLKEFSSA
jgi:peptidoglycan/xylan/chitin deacetylase (PgdA/CDA1 family)